MTQPGDFDPEEVLSRVEGDRELLAVLVGLFEVESDRLLDDLRRCLKADDAPGMELAAHSLRGCISHFGAPGASRLALALEMMGREVALEGALPRLRELESEVAGLGVGLARLAAGSAS
jgi:two-component system sensor histidine kinase/response regulator